MNGNVLLRWHYFDNTKQTDDPYVYTVTMVEEMKQRALLRINGYYGPTDEFLYEALDAFGDHIKGKEVGIIGSTTPWYESIVLAYGGYPTSRRSLPWA